MRYLPAALSGLLLGAAAMSVAAQPTRAAPQANGPATPPTMVHSTTALPPSAATRCPPGSSTAPRTRVPGASTATDVPGTPPNVRAPDQTAPIQPCR